MLVRRINLALLILATFWWIWWSLNDPFSLRYPMAYPQVLLLIIAGSFIFMLVKDLLTKSQGTTLRAALVPDGNWVPLARFFATVVLTVTYVEAWDYLGYFPCTLLYLIVVLLVLGERSWLVVVGIPVVLTALIYLVFFLLLELPLPLGPLEYLY